MDKKQLKNIIDSPLDYDESTEETIRSYLRDSFSKQVRWVTITFFALLCVSLVPLIFSGIQFFRVDETKMQILYAAVFTCSWMPPGQLQRPIDAGFTLISWSHPGRERCQLHG